MEDYVICPSSGPMKGLVNWIDQQPVTGWRIVTLQYPRWSNLDHWRKAIKHTMRELEQSFLKGPLVSKNMASGAAHLRRVVMMGGSKEQDIAFHAHCLVDGLGDDQIFKKKLHTAWVNNVRKIVVKGDHQFYENEATTFARAAVNGASEYIYYTVRHEGTDLKFGVDKVEVPLTYLT